jgi:hypothetical protein
VCVGRGEGMCLRPFSPLVKTIRVNLSCLCFNSVFLESFSSPDFGHVFHKKTSTKNNTCTVVHSICYTKGLD